MKCVMCVAQIGILFCFLVASNALDHCNEKCEEVRQETVNAPLQSEVLLPCNFKTRLNPKSNNLANKKERVRWSHINSLLNITQDGNIIFDDPREGRITVFSNLASGGNFSIIIHNLQSSDLGTYCCELNWECWRVKITQSADQNNELNPWLYFAAGAGLFILFFIVLYLFSKFHGKCIKRSPTYVNGEQSEGWRRGIATVYM